MIVVSRKELDRLVTGGALFSVEEDDTMKSGAEGQRVKAMFSQLHVLPPVRQEASAQRGEAVL